MPKPSGYLQVNHGMS